MAIKRPLFLISGMIGIGYFMRRGLPALLRTFGLHPHYEGRAFDLSGKRALVITTSHDTLGNTGKKTGVFPSEMTVPYYQFIDSNMQVDVASIQGGDIPLEPNSLGWPLGTEADQRFLADPIFQNKAKQSLRIDDVDFTAYDLVYMAGGWGAAYDLGTSEVLGQKLSDAYAAGAVLGSVCHGALGFLKVKDEEGNPLIKGRRMTGVTDKQVQELGISITPQHPEHELRAAGVIYESNSKFRDLFASHTVVDGRLVTGQNQNDGAETAQKMMSVLERMAK